MAPFDTISSGAFCIGRIIYKMKDIRFAVFDMDGTLVDSMGYWLGIIDELLAVAAPDISLPEDVRRKVQTMGPKRAGAYLASIGIFPEDFSLDEEEGLKIMQGHYERDVAIRAGARELLESLKAQGVRMGLATLTPRALVDACLKRHGLDGFFEFFYTADEYPEGKSSTRIFLDAAKHFDTSCESIWLFEDSLYSVKTAKTLGMRAAVTEDEEQREHFAALYEIADAYFKNGFTDRIK